MFEVAWKEFNKSGRMVIKRRSFSTEKAINKFVERLFQKDNFQEIIAFR